MDLLSSVMLSKDVADLLASANKSLLWLLVSQFLPVYAWCMYIIVDSGCRRALALGAQLGAPGCLPLHQGAAV